MKVITVRSVPEDTYLALKRWAKINRRSLQEQVKCILEREVQLVGKSPELQCQDWRTRLRDRDWGDITADIRRERDR